MLVTKRTLAILLGCVFLYTGAFLLLAQGPGRNRFGVLDEALLMDIPASELPEGTLYITYDRRLYERGDMTLIIPSIDVFTPIGESTEPEYLKEMPGLYEFAQLPGEGNVNTSIAGHRDIYDMAFYSLDKVEAGDYLYLLYKNTVYRYEYSGARIVSPDNWDVIRPQGMSSLTLTTCDPIGTTLNRLVVQGQLVDIQEFDGNYRFAANSKEDIQM